MPCWIRCFVLPHYSSGLHISIFRFSPWYFLLQAALITHPWFLHPILSSVPRVCSWLPYICFQASSYLTAIWNPQLTEGSCSCPLFWFPHNLFNSSSCWSKFVQAFLLTQLSLNNRQEHLHPSCDKLSHTCCTCFYQVWELVEAGSLYTLLSGIFSIEHNTINFENGTSALLHSFRGKLEAGWRKKKCNNGH